MMAPSMNGCSASPQKSLFLQKGIGSGRRREEVLSCFLKETLVQKKTNTQYSEYHHRPIYNTNY